MKKKVAAPVLAILLAIGGWFFGSFGGNPGSDLMNLQQVDEIPEQIAKVEKEGMAPNKYVNAFVVKVTDGDTMEVTYKGDSHKVRLLCVDTPESVKQGVALQEYSKEASSFTKDLALNQSVKLVFDKGLKDRYGRLLAYVILKNDKTSNKEVFLNGLLVRNGFARVEIVSPNSKLKDYFRNLQQKAIEEKVGIWGLPKDKQPFIMDKDSSYIPRYKLKEAG